MVESSAIAYAQPSASVLALRDGTAGLEVLLLRRAPGTDFAGQYVFPGGRVDPGDAHPDLWKRCNGLTDRDASRHLGLPVGGMAWWVAAVREVFEESGLLLGHSANDLDATELAAARMQLLAQEDRFASLAAQANLSLNVGAIHYFSYWITPEWWPRRYATRFFLAALPTGQDVTPDGREIDQCLWLRPQDALNSGLDMLRPTRANLAGIAAFPTVEQALTRVASLEPGSISPILPRRIGAGSDAVMVLPGEPGYPE